VKGSWELIYHKKMATFHESSDFIYFLQHMIYHRTFVEITSLFLFVIWWDFLDLESLL